MLNELWETSGPAYRILVFSAMGLIAVGLILTVVGANTGNNALMWSGMPFLGLGAVLHVVGLGVRGRAARLRLKAMQESPTSRR
ncbi:DUF3188 domain-containing protein [Psychromicrobium xiongbiense]|uniref:DUF3188 domain-containing protein n=1 Tax=Psychromicrobium xiongbiense TaxID=3051184 RepID=UPI0025535853|nr:DUF3188 domain-containing protein [Psychromicrobium sp. YIM S02556]